MAAAAASSAPVSDAGGRPFREWRAYGLTMPLSFGVNHVAPTYAASERTPPGMRVAFREDRATVAGKGPYYFVRLVARAEFWPHANGVYDVHMAINGRDVIQATLAAHHGRPLASSLTWITGTRRTQGRGRAVLFTAENYAQTTSVRKGRNVVTVRVYRRSGTGFRRMVIVGGGIGKTRAPPEELSLLLQPKLVELPVGAEATSRVVIRSRQNWPDRGVTISVTPPPGGLRIVSARIMSWARVGSHRVGHISVRGVRPGNYELIVGVTKAYNEPSRLLLIHVYAPAGAGSQFARVGWSACVGLVGALAIAATYRVTRRRRAPA